MVRLFKKTEGGFTYIGLMVSVVIIGIMTSVVGMSLKTASRIEKEKELIWIGHQYRLAIKSYYFYRQIRFQKQIAAGSHTPVNLAGQTVPQFYPTSIDDLLKDPNRGEEISLNGIRYKIPTSHLRKKFIDPMTGKDDWVLIPAGSNSQSGEGQAVGGQNFWGVRSNSDRQAMKTDNFDLQDEKFEGKTKYSEWEFTYDPNEFLNPAQQTQ